VTLRLQPIAVLDQRGSHEPFDARPVTEQRLFQPARHGFSLWHNARTRTKYHPPGAGFPFTGFAIGSSGPDLASVAEFR
jgi:hypothetical protein